MRTIDMPEFIHVKAPEGTLSAIRDAARRNGKSSAEYVREAVREQLRTEE